MVASKFIENDTLSQIQGFVHLQDTTSVALQIKLYDIFLGNKPDPQDTIPQQLQDIIPEDERLLHRERLKMDDNDSL